MMPSNQCIPAAAEVTTVQYCIFKYSYSAIPHLIQMEMQTIASERPNPWMCYVMHGHDVHTGELCSPQSSGHKHTFTHWRWVWSSRGGAWTSFYLPPPPTQPPSRPPVHPQGDRTRWPPLTWMVQVYSESSSSLTVQLHSLSRLLMLLLISRLSIVSVVCVRDRGEVDPF